MATVIVAGLVCVLFALATVRVAVIDVYLLLLFVFTIGVGSRITIQIPRFKSHISVSDIFIFLALILYGGEFAVILAAIEAAASSWRFCNRKLTVFFNSATMAISTSAVVLVLKMSGLYTENQLHGHGENTSSFIIALSLIALTQFLVNTSFASIHGALKDHIPLWETWKTKYIWTFFSYFVGAASAGLLVQVADVLGLGILLATFPVIFFVFLSYRMYLKNVEISMQQAEQAEQYAKIMESQSDALRESEERFRSAFDYAPIGIGLVSPTGQWLKANHALTEILGYTETDFLATDFQSITLPEDLGLTLVKVHELLAGKIANCQMEQRYIHKTGRTVWTSWSVSAANDTKTKQPNLIFQIQDITDKKSAEEKLQHDATHDALTGLPNRLLFMKSLDRALERRRLVDEYKVSVLFIDLDRFKYVNDSLGHLIGDELLKEISSRLRECMRPSDLVARLGGDEFTILVEGTFDTAEVTRIASRIQQKFGIPFDLRGHEVYSSASIGILHATDKHSASEDVMRDADTAMYQAKRAGKARHEVFDEEMHSAAKEILKLETDLRRAVEREEIEVFYQPIYSLKSGEIECFESLARWDHPELGKIAPTKFIPLAEEIGLIDRLCEQVLRRACREIGSLQSRSTDLHKYSVSVNLSCRQFSQNGLVKSIEDILAETGFSPTDLKLEITESVFFEHQDRAVGMLNQLRNMGIEIDVDDFGTGYSNLGYLRKLPISALKIDRSFVSMIDEAGNNDEIVRAIINLARTLGLKVVAEGVETEAQRDLLTRLECEGGQGFLFAKPMRFAELKAFLSEKQDAGLAAPMYDDVSTIALVQ
ncbi:MAG TPA: EAL domain-containing protein [Pyrinomonadaceae bacterium]|nr:EAL domain-containing protein [Acidobacteriota bacterium]HQZ95364.1 EAL domain-containing protein [Pyrinomonadaceae bacterium]